MANDNKKIDIKYTIKNILVITFVFLLGFVAGRLPLRKFQENLSMTKLNSVTVVDGDTIHTVNDGKIEKVRLLKIDCHETSYNNRAEFQSQLYKMPLERIYQKGLEEKTYLENLLNENSDKIYLKREGKDKYGRTLGYLFIDKKQNVNQLLLDNNICPPYVNHF